MKECPDCGSEVATVFAPDDGRPVYTVFCAPCVTYFELCPECGHVVNSYIDGDKGEWGE